MKGKLPLILLVVALVGALVWIMRPPESKGPTVAEEPSSLPPRSDRSGYKPGPTPRDPSKSPPSIRTATGLPEGVVEQMVSGQGKRAEHEIARLVRTFNLSPAQEGQLRDWYQGQLAEIESQLGQPGGQSPEVMSELASLMRGEGLDQALEEILSAEQREILDQKREEDREAQVQRYAAAELNKLQRRLELTTTQREAVWNVLYDQTVARYDQIARQMPYRSLVSNGRGVDLGAPAPSLAAGGGASQGDIASIVDPALAPYTDILTPEQLDTLRGFLENEARVLVASQKEGDPWRVEDPAMLPLIRGISSQ